MTDERRRGIPRRRVVNGLVAIVLAAAAFAAYGASAGTSGTARATAKCGDVPVVPAKDPQKLIKQLSADQQAKYVGFQGTVFKSAWANWKPKKKPPYTVGIISEALTNPYQTYIFNLLQKFFKRSKLVSNVTFLAAAKSGDAPAQLQLYQSLVQQKVDIILAQPASASAFAPAIEAAGQAGIPTVVMISNVDTPYSVDVTPNAYQDGSAMAREVLKNTSYQGSYLLVHGVPGVTVDIDTFFAFKKMLDLCPNVKIIGEINGFFAPPVAKGAVLQWLATHTDKVDGVLLTAIMAPSVMQAFLQAGRPVPSVGDLVAQKGSVAYWAQNLSKGYKGAGTANGATSLADLLVRTTLRILAGQGPKFSDILWTHPIITNANVKTYVNPAWTLDTPGTVEPAKSTWSTEKDLDQYFNHPERKDGIRY